MGCGQVKSKPLYHNNVEYIHLFGDNVEDKPKHFIPKDKLQKDQAATFDDSLFFAKADAFHLDRIEIFMVDGYVQGIGVTYTLDGIKMSKINKGKKMPSTSYELDMGENEHIEFIQFQYTTEGVREIMIKTSEGNMLVMDEETGNDGGDCYIRDFNLADNGEALIGFKGKYGRIIKSLGFYKATRINENVIIKNKNKAKKQPMRVESHD